MLGLILFDVRAKFQHPERYLDATTTTTEYGVLLLDKVMAMEIVRATHCVVAAQNRTHPTQHEPDACCLWGARKEFDAHHVQTDKTDLAHNMPVSELHSYGYGARMRVCFE